MKKFTVTFGKKGTEDEVTHEFTGNCVFDYLSTLHRAGWEMENITEITITEL